MQGDTGVVDVLHVLKDTAAVLAKLHDIAHKVGGCQDLCFYHRLFGTLDQCRIRIVGGVVDELHLAVGHGDTVDNGGCCGDQIQIVLPFQTLLNDLHVQQSQETAAESKAQCNGGLRFERKGGIVELELFQRLPQIAVACAVHGVDAGEYHGVDLAVSGKGLCAGTVGVGDGVADLCVADALDGSGEIADFAGTKLSVIDQCVGGHIAGFHNGEFCAGCHELDDVAHLDRALLDADIDDNAFVCVIVAVEDQRL